MVVASLNASRRRRCKTFFDREARTLFDRFLSGRPLQGSSFLL
jgi:hypothetical protein